MRILRLTICCLTFCLGWVPSHAALAGPYADDMAKCLVKQTGPEERAAIMKWMFAAMSLHPDVASMAKIDTASRNSINSSVGALFQRLLVDSCRAETKQAVRFEGALAIQTAFSVLGQVAMQELMTNPNVSAGLVELEKYVDQKLIAELGTPDPEPAK